MKRTWLHTAYGIGAASGVFSLVMVILILVTFVQLKRSDPLNTPELVRLRERFVTDSGNDQLKSDIRDLDLLVRKAFFTSKSQIRTGSYLLIGGLIVFVASLLVAVELTKKLPAPVPVAGDEVAWAGKTGGRGLIVLGGLLLGIAAVTIGHLPRARLTVTPGSEDPSGVPDGARPTPVSREELEKNWPCFRGVYGNATVTDRKPPAGWNGETGENILWKAPIPRHGYSSPIVWGNRIFLTGGEEESRELCCFDAETGELLWTVEDKDVRGAPAQLPVVNDNTGWAAPTPVTDGNRVFVMFATGNVLAFDID